MKRTFILVVLLFLSGGSFHAQKDPKSIGKTATQKLESQDFNSSRTNKDKGRLTEEKNTNPAPPAVTIPPPVVPADTTKQPKPAAPPQ